MKPVHVVGTADTDETVLVERLVERLSAAGRVATVKQLGRTPKIDTSGTDTDRHRTAGADATYGVTADGSWFATGTDQTVDDLLAELAPEFDYVVVQGYPDADLPTVALGGRDHEGATIQTAPDADSVDVDAVVDALDAHDPFETLESLVERVKATPDAEYSGAIATFTGRVREREGPDDEATELLEFEKYDGVAAEKMATIERELEQREGVYEVLLHHRTGVIDAGEDIVFVVVLAGHRTEAFRTVEDGINRLKAEVPLFKKEVTVDGEFWAHQHDTGEEPEDGVGSDVTPSPAEPSPEHD